MIAAFSDSKFVSSLMSPITFRISAICPMRATSFSSPVLASLVAAWMRSMSSMVADTVRLPSSAPSLIFWDRTEACSTCPFTVRAVRSISVMDEAVSSAICCTLSVLVATWRMVALISCTDEEALSTDSWSEAALRATSSTLLPISTMEEADSSAARERLSTRSLMLRIEELMLASNEAASSTVSS